MFPATNQVFEFSVPIVTFSLVTDAVSSHNGTGFTALVTSFSDASNGSCSGSKFLCDTDRYMYIIDIFCPSSLRSDIIGNFIIKIIGTIGTNIGQKGSRKPPPPTLPHIVSSHGPRSSFIHIGRGLRQSPLLAK